MGFVNVTSLRRQLDQVLRMGLDVVGLAEVTLGNAGQRELRKELADAGYDVIWGAPCKRGRYGARVRSGGVAVIVKRPLKARMVPPSTPKQQQLFDAGRLVHIGIPFGKDCLHYICVYGYTNAAPCREQRQKNEELMQELRAMVAQLGNAPVVLAGDMNTPLHKSAVLTSNVQNGVIVDMAMLDAAARGLEEPETTCLAPNARQASRIDFIFGNPIAARAMTSCGLSAKCEVPVHKALEAHLRLGRRRQRGKGYRRPKKNPWLGAPGKQRRRGRGGPQT